MCGFCGSLQVVGVSRGVCEGEHTLLFNTIPTISTAVQAAEKKRKREPKTQVKRRTERYANKRRAVSRLHTLVIVLPVDLRKWGNRWIQWIASTFESVRLPGDAVKLRVQSVSKERDDETGIKA